METYRGYSESDLVKNRSSLWLYGGSPADRRAWAEEAQQNFAAEGPLQEVLTPEQLASALARPHGVVYVPDAAALSSDAQAQVLRCLQSQEERPKIILGLLRRPQDARAAGSLRDDLLYRLSTAHVDLGGEGVQQKIRARRLKHPKAAAPKKQAPAPKKSRR